MALFIDGPAISIEDLRKYENNILDVANTESIDLAGKIALAHGDIANQLTVFLVRRLPNSDPVAFPWAAWHNRLGNVVVTAPLRQWHIHKTLAMVYRDAYNNQLNDRYHGKWNEYEKLGNESSRIYFRLGVGVVANPVRKASTPLLSATAGIGSSTTLYAAVAWINEEQQEGQASEIAQLTTSDGQLLVITAVNPPSNAISWNAYVGISPESITLQNGAPIAVSASWAMNVAPQQGVAPGTGQIPTWFVVDNHVIQRG